MNTAVLFFATLASVGQIGSTPGRTPSSAADRILIEHCVVSAIKEVQLPSPEAGVLISLFELSTDSPHVKEGDILGEVDSADLVAKEAMARLEVAVAKAQAESEAELQAAIKTQEVAEAELKAAQTANRRSPGSFSENDIRRLALTVERAGFEIELRRVELANYGRTAKIKEAQVDAVRIEQERRIIKAPFDGEVVDVLKQRSEWVQPGETVLKLVKLDRLRVQGFLSAYDYAPSQVKGAKVLVTVQLEGNKEATAEGVIKFVSPVVEVGGDYRVWTEIENRRDGDHWVFSPGSTARMEIELKSGPRAVRPVSTKAPAN
jgi:multidrug efflux pump subunit AcrA (membrane-fusion protein)